MDLRLHELRVGGRVGQGRLWGGPRRNLTAHTGASMWVCDHAGKRNTTQRVLMQASRVCVYSCTPMCACMCVGHAGAEISGGGGGGGKFVLFIDAPNAQRAKWDGATLSREVAAAEFGADEVAYMHEVGRGGVGRRGSGAGRRSGEGGVGEEEKWGEGGWEVGR